jgi:Na+-transporting methylmalonyl-CoA/oxaloacetate decarboxylase gamma subunit
MTTVAFVFFVLAVIVMVVVHAWTMNRLEARVHARQVQLDEADEGRRQAVYQQQKAAQTVIAQQQTAGRVLADQSRALHEETRLMQQRLDALARDVRKG